MSDIAIKAELRRARGKFAAMAGAYSLGVFNDNFFKQAAMLLAVAAGLRHVQGWATMLFTLPFIVAAAPAGWLADRFPKRTVVIGAKAMELGAMALGAAGMVLLSWPLVLAMVCTMGLQSAIFGPALNGSIPELYPPAYVTRANGILRVFVTGAILLGVALAGLALEGKALLAGVPAGRWTVAAACLAVATGGLASSFAVPRRPAAAPGLPFPWDGPVRTLRTLAFACRDGQLAAAIGADLFVWTAGALQIMVINVLGSAQLGCGEAATSGLVAAELVGIAAGGLAAGWLARGARWHRVLAPAAAGMGAAMLGVRLAVAAPAAQRYGWVLAALLAAGAFGGLLMIPCEAFIQLRPPARRRGAVIAASNFVIFAGIFVSGPLANAMNEHLAPATSFAIMGASSLGFALVLRAVLRKVAS